jgi:PhnB protein
MPDKTELRPYRYRNVVIPHIYFEDAAAAIEFYAKAFGAKQLGEGTFVKDDNGLIVHAEIVFHGTTLMLSDVTDATIYGSPQAVGTTSVSLHFFVEDTQPVFDKAIAAGCVEVSPVTKLDYGATTGVIRDPFNHVWAIMSKPTEKMMNFGRDDL